MTLAPLLAAPPLIQAHVLAALAALLIGPLALFRRRRDRLHRVAGYGFVVTLAATALSGLLIPSFLPVIGRFGPIHALALLALWTLFVGVRHIHRGDRVAHAESMRSLYWQALGIAGLFTLIPGRTLNEALFPAAPQAGWVAIALGLAALGWQALATRRRLRQRPRRA